MDPQTIQNAAKNGETIAQAYATLGGIVAIVISQIGIAMSNRKARRTEARGQREIRADLEEAKVAWTAHGKELKETREDISGLGASIAGIVGVCQEHRRSTDLRIDSHGIRLQAVEQRQYDLLRNGGTKAGGRREG